MKQTKTQLAVAFGRGLFFGFGLQARKQSLQRLAGSPYTGILFAVQLHIDSRVHEAYSIDS